jgi:quercetin dioxygenase-like cupin family protein
VDLRDYVTFDLGGASGRRVFATDVVAVDLVCLEPHQDVEPRTFPTADAIYTVLGGRAWVVTDEAEVTLEPLQSVMVPAGIPHALRNDSPDPLILQAVISPPDEAPVAPAGPVEQPRAEPGPSVLDRLRRVLGGQSGRGTTSNEPVNRPLGNSSDTSPT